ncbi:MAG: YkgJ family cysteine cluster protein [Gammaproteobacteria bacterium]|nr:YkgJ family cysteine cluster protein [Gammaproteobacteria bacterium]MCW8911223.1 YkgJ family cysteine cluster protein [Gammaproteobacteria bacterium]MCW9004099.1 YkgJ family cysteine cluster protein [Gammaproteobacteria bacterium]MCW9056006.1 YkgJ family cysteine cluster protein [Gammaproteobacteria bacterium]
MSQPPECDYRKPQRLSFTDDEARFPWLAILLNAYAVIDKGISAAIESEQKQGRQLACAKGCSSCCTTHQDIPVYPLELMGMSWYVIEKLQSPLREQLKQQLNNIDKLNTCPFLLEGACSIHPMRPIACRQFNVLNKACADGEDAFHTRKNDVMKPIKRFTEEAFDIMLPFYGIKRKGDRKKAIKQGKLHAVAKVMRECNWQTMPEKMTAFESKIIK